MELFIAILGLVINIFELYFGYVSYKKAKNAGLPSSSTIIEIERKYEFLSIRCTLTQIISYKPKLIAK